MGGWEKEAIVGVVRVAGLRVVDILKPGYC